MSTYFFRSESEFFPETSLDRLALRGDNMSVSKQRRPKTKPGAMRLDIEVTKTLYDAIARESAARGLSRRRGAGVILAEALSIPVSEALPALESPGPKKGEAQPIAS